MTPFSLLIFTFLISLSHQQPPLPLNPSEQELVYLALESINPATPWRTLFPDDLCLSAPHGVVCGLFSSSTRTSHTFDTVDADGSDDSVLVPHIVELSFGFVSDSSPNPPCSDSSVFPSSVFDLPHLRKLFFYHCFENKPVPLPDFGAAGSELEELVLVENPALSGSLKGILVNSTSLRRVILTGSNISGEIPGEIMKLPLLEQLTISRNPNLGGVIPTNIGSLHNLKVLVLSNNGLTGRIPDSIKGLNLLFTLDLSYNSLMGRIPNTLKSLKKLQFLDLSYNKFTNFGIPLFLSEMVSLREVYLSGNPLGGAIPEIWEHLGGLLAIGLSKTGLIGNIPSSMGVFLSNASYISLEYNMLEGAVPAEFGNKVKVKGNSHLCVDKSLQMKGILGSLKSCDEIGISSFAPVSGGQSLFWGWDLVIVVVGFWSFSWLWHFLCDF